MIYGRGKGKKKIKREREIERKRTKGPLVTEIKVENVRKFSKSGFETL